MAKVERIEINDAGAIAVLNSEGVQSALLSYAAGASDRANAMSGGGYSADVQPGKTRAHALVKTSTYGAMRDNARNNTLLKAMGG